MPQITRSGGGFDPTSRGLHGRLGPCLYIVASMVAEWCTDVLATTTEFLAFIGNKLGCG